jgi:3-deoxy-D-manno-octulosonic-acid transferase
MESQTGISGISALLRSVRSERVMQPPRPKGRLVWLHLAQDVPIDSIASLRLALEDFSVLITQPEVKKPEPLHVALPAGRRAVLDQFIAHWQPEILLWGAPENGLAIARRADKTSMKLIFADISEQGLLPSFRGRQLTEFLQYFPKVLLGRSANLSWFKRHGLKAEQLVECDPLTEIAAALPENEALLRRVSGALGARPIWCAAGISRGETGALLAAHRHAIKAVPNLLLIIVPRAAADVISAQIAAEGWRVSLACPDNLPDSNAEVLLAQNTEDLPTWMQLATVSYMGGTLYGPEAADPFAAVAVGSAVLCGPMQAPYAHRYERLKHANGLAFVETNGALPAMLVEALSPDRSAELAMQGWAVGSEGAETVQIIAHEICALLEGER